jgi:hypothetical protein
MLQAGHIGHQPRGAKGIGDRAEKPTLTYANLPLSFEANQGQTAWEVKFLSHGKGYVLFLTSDEAVLALRKSEGGSRVTEARRAKLEHRNSKMGSGYGVLRPLIKGLVPPINGFESRSANSESEAQVVLHMKLLAANPAARVRGEEELPGKANYFMGNNPAKWRANVPTYAKVSYKNVYRGVDLVYYGNQGRLEHDFVVSPGADSGRIRLRLEGSKKVSLDAVGNLMVAVEGGEVRFERPLIYQEDSGGRREIPGGYVLNGAHEVAFEVGSYDRSKPLVIDPVVAYSTYLGGNSNGQGSGIAADSSGNAYVTGWTASTNFPTSAGAYQTSLVGGTNAFITKLNPTGSALVYSTYLGGGSDYGIAIAVDSSGDAYVAGTTYSSSFPTTEGAFQTSLAGYENAFVAGLNPKGSELLYSTYLGGNSYDWAYGIAVDSSGNAYVSGGTSSTNFPVSDGAYQTTYGGGDDDAFVTKLNPTGTKLVYSTYLGGSDLDYAGSIAIDSSANAYVTGQTYSSNFPTTPEAFQAKQPECSGCSGGFVSKLNPTGTALVYSTYLGGNKYDFGSGVAVDGSGDAYVTGGTSSSDFPTEKPLQGALKGTQNAFVTELSPEASSLVYSTYLGGSGSDFAESIALDPQGNAYVTGSTSSPDFPGASASTIEPTYNGAFADGFVAAVQAGGVSLLYSTYGGGTGYNYGIGIAVDSSQDVYVTGTTSPGPTGPLPAFGSFDFPTTPGAFQRNATEAVNCAVYPTGYVPFTQVTSHAFGTYAGVGVTMVVGYTSAAAMEMLATKIPEPSAPGLQGFCGPATLVKNSGYFGAFLPTAPMRLGDFSLFTGQLIDPTTGKQFTFNGVPNVIPPDELGRVYAWPVGTGWPAQAFVAKFGVSAQAQTAALENQVLTLIDSGTLSSALGRPLLALLNDALAALGDPSGGTAARAAFEAGRDSSELAAVRCRGVERAIYDLDAFIVRVQLLVIFRKLKPSEGRILIDTAEKIIRQARAQACGR